MEGGMKRLLSVGILMLAVSLTTTGARAQTGTPTFAKDVAPILYKNCATCHRPGEIAPMSLLSYNDARPWAKAIKDKVASREMPPWLAEPSGSVKFRNDRRLSDAQVDTIVRWVDAGAPKGNDADLPAVPRFEEGWKF